MSILIDSLRKPLITSHNLLNKLGCAVVDNAFILNGVPDFLSSGMFQDKLVFSCEHLSRMLNVNSISVYPWSTLVVDFSAIQEKDLFFPYFINKVTYRILQRSGYGKSFSLSFLDKGFCSTWEEQIIVNHHPLELFNGVVLSVILDELIDYAQDIS